jgi:hypothetical protein
MFGTLEGPTTGHTVVASNDSVITWLINPGQAGIELTLGRDGRIDAAILRSVRRVSPTGGASR